VHDAMELAKRYRQFAKVPQRGFALQKYDPGSIRMLINLQMSDSNVA
jgi:hypothetical protein